MLTFDNKPKRVLIKEGVSGNQLVKNIPLDKVLLVKKYNFDQKGKFKKYDGKDLLVFTDGVSPFIFEVKEALEFGMLLYNYANKLK